MMSLAAALGALVTLVVFVFDMVIFNILRNRVRDAGGDAMLVSSAVRPSPDALKT